MPAYTARTVVFRSVRIFSSSVSRTSIPLIYSRIAYVTAYYMYMYWNLNLLERCRTTMTSQWQTQWEAKGPGSKSGFSRASESSSADPRAFLSAQNSGGAIASSSFSRAWSCTSHCLGGMPEVSYLSLSLSLSLSLTHSHVHTLTIAVFYRVHDQTLMV